MRNVLTTAWVQIPSDITLRIKSRKVTIKGKRGEITKDFSHLSCELETIKQDNKKRKGDYLRIQMWMKHSKHSCVVGTLTSLIKNMITGVTEVSNHSRQFQGGAIRTLVSLVVVCKYWSTCLSSILFLCFNLINNYMCQIGLPLQNENGTRTFPN